MPKVLGIVEGSVGGSTWVEQKGEHTQIRNEFSRTYYVLSDSLNDNEGTIIATSGIPPVYYPALGAWCKKLSPKETRMVIHPTTGVPASIWEVQADFDNDFDYGSDETQHGLGPTARRPTVNWEAETEQEVLERDAITGDPIQTEADEPILLNGPVVVPILVIKRYETFPFNPNTILSFSNRVNSAAFWGAGVGTALMMPMTAEEETLDGVRYAVVTYRIKFKKPDETDTWKARPLHHGFKYRETAGAVPIVYTDKHGNPATVNLTTGGLKKTSGSPEYLEFNRFKTANFNSLSLGPF